MAADVGQHFAVPTAEQFPAVGSSGSAVVGLVDQVESAAWEQVAASSAFEEEPANLAASSSEDYADHQLAAVADSFQAASKLLKTN